MDLMEGISAFDGAIGGLTKLATLYKNVRNDGKTAEFSNAIEAVRTDLNGAREKLTSLIGENLLMKQQIAALTAENMKLNQAAERHKAFDVIAENYELVTVGEHTTLYAPITSGDAGEPAHYLCVQCYEDRQKSIVQMKWRGYGEGVDILACPRCKSEYRIPNGLTLRL